MKRLVFALLCLLAAVSINAQTISAKEKEQIRKQYVSFCKEMNEQLPVDIDEITRLNSIVFMNWTITANYKLVVDADDLSADDLDNARTIMKEGFKEAASKMMQSGSYDTSRTQFKALMRVTGLKFRATYRDLFDKFLFSIVLDYRDF